MMTCRITLPDSPHPILLEKSRILGTLDKMNYIFWFKNTIFLIFGCWFLPENLGCALKIMTARLSWTAAPQPPGSYAYVFHAHYGSLKDLPTEAPCNAEVPF